MSDTAEFVGLMGEWAAVAQVPRLMVRLPGLLARPRVAGPVLVLPGRGANDASTWPLRGYLTTLGYRVRGWGVGFNDGDVGRLSVAVVPAVEAMNELAGGPIALIGQSMGGTVAREVARERPDLVSQLITLGTPLFRPHSRRPIQCPVTAIYSEADRIVRPRWAVDHGPGVDNIEVRSTHLGMGIDPDVWAIVADRLASGSQPGGAKNSSAMLSGSRNDRPEP